MQSVFSSSQCLKLGVLVTTVGLATMAQAVFQPSQLPDPSRRWSATLSLRQGYDDNVNSSPNEEGSATSYIEPRLYLNLPMDRTFIGFRYSYQASVYWDRRGDDVDQAHVADLLISHRFNPRLTLSIDDSIRRGIHPELVEVIGGVPQISRQQGDYWYNSLSAGLTWNASRRWLLSLSQSWETYAYDVASYAATSDRDSLSTGVSATYTMDPVSSVAANFRYSVALYDQPGPNDQRDSRTETVYLSYTRLLNPQLTIHVAGGAGFTQFGDEHDDVSPYAAVSMAYTYLPESTLSLNANYAFVTTDVAAYRSTDSFVLSLQLSHRVTTKCRFSAGVDYINRSYQNPNPTFLFVPDSQNEDAVRLRFVVSYRFTRWLSADLNFTHERVWSDLAGRDYDRNRVDGGLRFTF